MSVWFIQRQKCDGAWEPMFPVFPKKEDAEECMRRNVEAAGRYQPILRLWEYVPIADIAAELTDHFEEMPTHLGKRAEG